MIILLFFAFLSGLVTILAPCIWPILPIILSSSVSGGHKKPLGITLGIMTSFSLFTLTLSYLISLFGFDPNLLRIFAVLVIGFLGITLVVPALSAKLEAMVSTLSSRFAGTNSTSRNGFWGGYLTGFSLGIVWTPCAGPILATIATLAATQAVNFQIVLVTIAYVIGVGIPLFIFSYAGRAFFIKSRLLSKYTGRVQQVFGIIMILTALAIYTNYDKVVQAKLLDIFPSYAVFLTQLESNEVVKKQLDMLKNKKEEMEKDMPSTPNSLFNVNYPAPEFTGIIKWLNSEKPLTMADLKGKVVLIDFWTYTCINCIRTLPYVTSWYDKYKDKGFVVVGVHTPEFAFEKDTNNVLGAIKQYNIHYPVAQDNDFATWKAFDNHYWPAEYLIDAKGVVRRTHFGEGEYDKMEEAIQKLLIEAGQKTTDTLVSMPDQTPTGQQTPETYLGLARMERFASKQEPRLGEQTYTDQPPLSLHYFGYTGTWDLHEEYAVSAKGSGLDFSILANKVYLVAKPKNSSNSAKVYLDGKLIGNAQAGKDVRDGEVIFNNPDVMADIYELVDLHGQKGEHTLRLEFENAGTEVYAFTFG